MANHELLKLTAHQVKERGYKKAILAIGSCEAHGQHIAEDIDHHAGFDVSANAKIVVHREEDRRERRSR